MVLGGITIFKTQLYIDHGRVTGQYYCDNNLAPIAVPFAREPEYCSVLQDDNVCAHRSLLVTVYLQQQNITTLPWPAISH